MHKKRWFMALALALALLLTGYYFASPWAMLARFKADAQARKTDKMEKYVDFVAVRASLKAQIQERVRAKIGVERDNPIAAIGMGLANAVIDPVVQVAASPQGIVAMMNGENPLPGLNRLGIAVPEPLPRMQPQSWEAPPDPAPPEMRKVQLQTAPTSKHKQWRLAYQGLNHAVVQPVPFERGEPYLLMQRRGLFGWKVVDVQLGNIWPDGY